MAISTRTSSTTPVVTSYEVRIVHGQQSTTVATHIATPEAGVSVMTEWLKHCQQPGDRVELVAIQKECIEVIGTLTRRLTKVTGYRVYQEAANIIPIRAGKIQPSRS